MPTPTPTPIVRNEVVALVLKMSETLSTDALSRSKSGTLSVGTGGGRGDGGTSSSSQGPALACVYEPSLHVHSHLLELCARIETLTNGHSIAHDLEPHESIAAADAVAYILDAWRVLANARLADVDADPTDVMRTLLHLVCVLHPVVHADAPTARTSPPPNVFLRPDGGVDVLDAPGAPDRPWRGWCGMTSAVAHVRRKRDEDENDNDTGVAADGSGAASDPSALAASDVESSHGSDDTASAYSCHDDVLRIYREIRSGLEVTHTTMVDAEDHLKALATLALEYCEILTRSFRWNVCERLMARGGERMLAALDTTTVVDSLIQKADAELGAQVFKDLLLSFALPRCVIGMRHTLLLTRTAMDTAIRDYAAHVEHAHTAALRGPSRVWAHGVPTDHALLQTALDQTSDQLTRNAHFLNAAEQMYEREERLKRRRMSDRSATECSELERACVLLSGVAMTFAPTSSEARKGVAFKGHVRLPFLRFPKLKRRPGELHEAIGIELLPNGTWTFTFLAESRLRALCTGRGLVGLERAATLLLLQQSNG